MFHLKSNSKYKKALRCFKASYPEYRRTAALDQLRKREFSRLGKSKEVYVDYMGACLYPESLITEHATSLKSAVMGNTHSDSPRSCSSISYPLLLNLLVSHSSTRSGVEVDQARRDALDFFNADPEEWACIFTNNATGALKLVGEAFPFRQGGSLVLGVDSHNSVIGVRRYAAYGGAEVCYLKSGEFGGIDRTHATVCYLLRSFHLQTG